MENRADYHIKNIRTIAGVEGHGFIGALYLGRKRLGTVLDDASGAPILMELDDAAKNDLIAHLKTLPLNVCPFDDPKTGQPATIQVTPDYFVARLAKRAFAMKRIKSILKTKKDLAILENGKIYRISYVLEITPDTIAKYRSSYPDTIILNGMTPQEMNQALSNSGL